MCIVNKKKIRKKKEWPIRKDFKKLRELYWPSVTEKKIDDVLDKTRPYYLNDMGLSVDKNGKNISEDLAVYKWGMLNGCITPSPDEEQLYVWSIRAKDGNFRYTKFGTRRDFDKVIAKKYNNNN